MDTTRDNPLRHSLLTHMVVTGGTKVTKALAKKRICDLKPANCNPSNWNIDSFLDLNKVKILNERFGRENEWVYFPLDSSQKPTQTSFDKWDINQTIFILLSTCDLNNVIRMYVEDLRKLRNKLAHMSSQKIDDTKFEYQKTKVEVALGHCLKEIEDEQLAEEIHDMFQKIERGTIFQNEEQETEPAAMGASLGKRGHFGDEPTERKLETTIELLERIEPVLASKSQSLTVPDVGIRIVVKNCTTDRDKVISREMVSIFNDVIETKYDDFQELSNEMRHKMREAVIDTVLIFLSNGRQIFNVHENCVVLNIRCVSLVSLLLLFRDYVKGILDENIQLLETAVRRCDGYENTSLEVIILKDEFWRILTTIAEDLEKNVSRYEIKEHKSHKENGKSQSVASMVTVPESFPTKRKDDMNEYVMSGRYKQGHEQDESPADKFETASKKDSPGAPEKIEKAEIPEKYEIVEKSDSFYNQRQIIGSIDFGTSYTGWAWSNSVEEDKMNISDWKSKGTTNMECHKVPSAALFDKTGILKTFGFEAEEMYQDLKRKNIHQEWFFFQSFMYQIRLNKDTLEQTIQTELTESEGKTMLACDVLAAVLRYLKGMMLENIRKRNINIKEGDVYWVLTVVGERCSDEKLLMEQSAIQAELSKIHVVDESAATMAYLTSQFDDYEADSNKRQLQSPSGITHIVIDIGGLHSLYTLYFF
ncbi:uncharacterized protein LOC132723147 [Ruditapes philippinarum]|uniref:uncharacterized protein LOC132723147 n=1 Tax=Ruditapes philippinarum TaxID=129788 RepID=UPI00295BD33A|nr:uncharacterized protein LOC132723147 [Ruditapes philippinarum]